MSEPEPTEKESLIALAETYATFLRTKLSPHLRQLVSERDELDRKRSMMVLLCDDIAANENNPEAKFPFMEGCSAESDSAESGSKTTYTTPCTVAAFMASDPATLPQATTNEIVLGDGQTVPVQSSIEVSPVTTSVTSKGIVAPMYVEVGLNFFVELQTPTEVATVAEDRIEFLTDCIDRVQEEVDTVSADVKAVIKNLEDIGGEIRESEKGD